MDRRRHCPPALASAPGRIGGTRYSGLTACRARPVLPPPLKWAGGKRWQIPHLLPLWLPHARRRSVEPFCGGLAVALGLRPRHALLNDANPHLINFYRWLQRGLTIEVPLANRASVFYAHRARFNAHGLFNVPFGRYRRIRYVRDFTPYRQVLAGWRFTSGDFESLALDPDDFIYADPPYDVELTAGRGILHQEMPRGDPQGRMHGFQLWANLPSSLKMTAPRYQDISARDVPEAVDDDGTRVRVVCGEFWGTRGPVDGIAADPQYLDVWVPAGRRKHLPVERSRNVFAYVFAGSGRFRDASDPRRVRNELADLADGTSGEDAGNRALVLFDSGDEITVEAGEEGIRFLLVSGEPLREPVAWYGPIVMNTPEELEQAYAELRAGTFIR